MVVLSILFLPWRPTPGTSANTSTACPTRRSAASCGEWAINSALYSTFIGFAIAGIYRLVRRVRERWIWWASGVTALFMLFVIMVEPVFIAPIFNDYKPLPPGEVRDSILDARPRDEDSGGRRLLVRRLETDEAHQRQRLGTRGYDAHRAQ